MERRARNILIGCATGCGTVVLIVIGSCTGFVVWLNSPGDVLEPRRLVDADVTGYVEWTLRLEDPGTREFIDLMLESLQEINEGMPSPLPPAIRGPLTRLQNQRNERKLRKLFPIVLVWTVRPGEDADRDLHLLSASISGADHQLILMDWIMGFFMRRAEEVRTFEHRGEIVYRIGAADRAEEIPFFVHRGDVFLATSEDGARRAIDRLEDDAAPVEGASPVERWLAGAGDRTLHGVVTNHRGEVWRVWREMLDGGVDDLIAEEHRTALVALSLQGGFTAEGALDLLAGFEYADPAQAAAAEEPLTAAVDRALSDTLIGFHGLSVVGKTVRVEMKIADIPGRLEDGAAVLDPSGR
jgi:hypothetical protein